MTPSSRRAMLTAVLACVIVPLCAQTDVKRLAPFLERKIQSPDVTIHEMRNYLMGKVQPLPPISTGQAWQKRAAELRRDVLSKIIYHGWPREWVEAPVKMEDLGTIPSGKGYRIRKLRYQIVPGFYSTALLYEPEVMRGKMPAILNAIGHFPEGKAAAFQQQRCINQALHGILALSPDWIYFGELRSRENDHPNAAALDLVGSNAMGLFYLAMRRTLDYLDQHPNVDRSRIGITGHSGGGWQSIVLGALDERIAVSVPVEGFAAFVARIERRNGIGDIEQNATDLRTILDYTHLVAMRAPRPTLLVYGAEDNSFTGPLVRKDIFDDLRPFYRLYGAEDRLAWYLNTDPGDHNYDLDIRQQAYRFMTKHLGMPVLDKEIQVTGQMKSWEELEVGIPKDNLTIISLAKRLASRIERSPIPAAHDPARREWANRMRTELRETVRLRPVEVGHLWAVAGTHTLGMETRSYRVGFNNGLSARGMWLKALSTPDGAPASIFLDDDGRKASAAWIVERFNRDEQVFTLDLLARGDGEPKVPDPNEFAELLASAGDRVLGMEAAQLIAGARHFKKEFGASRLRLESSGIRSQVIALVASALEPDLFSEVVVRGGMPSLQYLLDTPVSPRVAADLFCLDLYKKFDIPHLAALAEPSQVTQTYVGTRGPLIHDKKFFTDKSR